MHELVVQPNLAIMPTQGVIEYFTEDQKSSGTTTSYSSTLRMFFAWTKGKDYRTITVFDALDYNKYLKSTCAESTTQTKISTLNEFFKFCKEVGLIDKNPFAVVKQSAAPNRAAEKFIVAKETEKLLVALRKKSEQRYILGLLLSALGTRITEIQQLSMCDFIEAPDGSILVNVLRKRNKRQLLPLRQDVWEEVKTFLNRPLSQFDKSPIFKNPSGNRISDVSLRAWIEEGAREAGITKKVTPHWLRHSFATNSLDNGADIRDVSWFLGHASLASTQIYAHPTNKKVGEFIKLPTREG